MSDDRFVTESDLNKQKAQRQKEWEAARKAGDPEKVPEEPHDCRPLYERLREQREKKQAEFEENHRLKNMVRGLDTEEVGFLEFVDNMKAKEERQRQMEERELLNEMHKHDVARNFLPAVEMTSSTSSTKPQQTPTGAPKISKQAELLKSAIKRKSTGDGEAAAGEAKRLAVKDESSSLGGAEAAGGAGSLQRAAAFPTETARQVAAVRPCLSQRAASLPGLDGYDSDSSSHSSDSSTSMGESMPTGAEKAATTSTASSKTASSGHGTAAAAGGCSSKPRT